MSLLKEISIDTIRRMPEDSSAEDIMYEIVLEGLKDSEEGRTITAEELANEYIGENMKDKSQWFRKITKNFKNCIYCCQQVSHS